MQLIRWQVEDFDLETLLFDNKVDKQLLSDYIFSKTGGKLSTLGKRLKEKAAKNG